jgi:hypothetical protein
MKRHGATLVCTLVLCIACRFAYGLSSEQLNFDFYAGWQGGQKQTLSVSGDGPYPGALFRSVQLEIPNRGLWLGVGASTGSCSDFRLFVQGWYFFPNNVQGAILLDPGATPVLIPADVKSHLDWWYVDVFGTYRTSGAFSVVLGARFDHHNYFTDDPEILNIVFFPLSNLMRFDLNVTSTIPYFGCQWGPASGLTLRAVYGPLGWINTESTLSQNNSVFRPVNWLGGQAGLSKKDFFELFGEYSKAVSASMQIGIFGRGTWLSAATHTSLSESLVNGSAEYDVSYRRTSWTVGASATAHFDIPQFLNW